MPLEPLGIMSCYKNSEFDIFYSDLRKQDKGVNTEVEAK